MGGHRTEGARHVRWGLFYRSDDLSGLERLPVLHPSMDPRLVTRRTLRGDVSDDYFQKMLSRANWTFALEHGAEPAQLVRGLAEPGRLPALFHCTYDTDGTGFATAMILDILGVPWETVVEDYLASNVYLDDQTSSVSRLIRWAPALLEAAPPDPAPAAR